MSAKFLQYSNEPFIPRKPPHKNSQQRADWLWGQKPTRLAEAIQKTINRISEVFNRSMEVSFVQAIDYKHLIDSQTLEFLGSEFVKATDLETGVSVFTSEQDLGVYVIPIGKKSERAAKVASARRFEREVKEQLGPTKVEVYLAYESECRTNHPGVLPTDIWMVFQLNLPEWDQPKSILVHQRDFEAFLEILKNDRQINPSLEFSLLDIAVMVPRGIEAKQKASQKRNTFEVFYDQICETYPWDLAPWAHPALGPFPLGYNWPQLDEENDMPLSQQDLENIVISVRKSGVATSWKQTLTLCATIAVFSIGCVAWWTNRLDHVEDKLDARITANQDKLDARITASEQKLSTRLDILAENLGKQTEVLARLDERIQTLNSSGNGSSKRPAVKHGSSIP